MRDYYATLQVDPGADPEVIEVAYRRLARKWHPDTNADPQAGARMQELNEAYEVLGDPARRQRYDAALVGRSAPSTGALPRRVPSLVVPVIGLLVALLGLRLLGSLARLPLVLALFGAAGYWFARSLRRTRQTGDPRRPPTGGAGRRGE
jgi:preprotein translocase subunit Sec63